MALVLLDRAQETATANTTVSFTLTGASTGYQSLAGVGNGNTTYYGATDGTNWETGIGTYSTTGPTLTRTTILASSNAGAAVTFSGTVTVFIDYPASKAVGTNTGYFQDNFAGTFVDGVVVDYDPVAGNGRFSVGTADKFTFYNGGVAGAVLGSIATNGDWSITRFLDVGNGTLIGGATNPVIAAAASANSYVQNYIHNDLAGTSASSDFAAYPDNGTDASGWIDMGITSSTYSDVAYPITGPNEGYIFMSAPSGASKTGNLVYATDSTGTENAHQWYSGGFGAAKNSWEMKLNSTNLTLAVPLVSSIATGTAPFTVASTTQVANLNAATAGIATTSTNLAGGAVGSVPYQSASATTLFLSGNTTTVPQFVTSTGTGTVAQAPTLTGSTGSGSVVLATSPILVTPALGTPSSGVVTNLTGTASININGTVGATTPTTGAFTGVTLSAGTASVAPIKLTNGTNLTTATAGAVEYDGSSFYASPAASTRGVLRTEQMVVLNTAYTLTSQTAAQKLFNATTNGAVTLPIGTYQFECQFSLSSLSVTSSSFGFAMVAGTAVIGSQGWSAYAGKLVTLATASNMQITYNTAANIAITTASTNSTGIAMIRGIIKITTAGTVIPSVSLGIAAAAVVGVNSYFKIAPVTGASAANITVGNWS
jgi:hypothetical protein